MNIVSREIRENADEYIISVATKTDAWTYAHEFGHCFGLPDEYSYTTDINTVVYVKPDGSKDEAVVASYEIMDPDAANATIMLTNSSTIVKNRHAWLIAIEARDLLTKKIGRKIKCDIV